nr:DJ-1/PfpI family protein [Sphingomonas sp. CARO-RG-8B-R24-01]
MQQAAVGEVVAVATGAGIMTMRPALHIQPQASVAEFDRRFPEDADYIVVPAVVRHDDPALLSWVRQQAAKGGTLVSICDGALVLASSGVLDGHRATAHWATAGYRRKTYPPGALGRRPSLCRRWTDRFQCGDQCGGSDIAGFGRSNRRSPPRRGGRSHDRRTRLERGPRQSPVFSQVRPQSCSLCGHRILQWLVSSSPVDRRHPFAGSR